MRKNVILVLVLCMVFTVTAQAYWDVNGDGTTDFNVLRLLASAWLEPDCGLTNSCNGLDVYPECGDGTVDFRDFATIARVFRQCTDPANSYCNHMPLTLYEPPTASIPDEGVQPFSGEFQIAEADLVIPGRGLDFTWARTYRSRTGSNTAMGNGWDFSYNIYLQSCSGNLIVHDGTGRKDTYYPQANGTWTADGFFGELELQPGNFFIMTFPDTTIWQFLALDDPNAPGKINAIVDRNGNSLNFEYDAQGRLTTVRDPLDTGSNGRVITIGYDSNDLIVDVNDWSGRHIQYEYYNDGDANGSAGDLRAVTSPAVTGTPTGNNFPGGKTTTYTYSKGFIDEELNHNLLTITDSNGQTYLTNTYGTTYGETDYDFVTRVTRPISDPESIISLVEGTQTPNSGNNYAVTRVVVNDRVGNVSEYFYDNMNRLVIERDYTGRAPDPNQPTSFDPNINIPVNPLRSGDPLFFETRYQYNKDSLPTRMDFANGNYVTNIYELDLDPNAVTRSRGNLREMHRFAGSLQAVSDQNEIVELFVYDPNFNFITRYTDARGNETLHEYDPNGNRIRREYVRPSDPNIVEDWQYNQFGQVTDHNSPDNGSGSSRRDQYTYYSDPCDPNYGYLKDVVIDTNNLALTTTYEYDPVGNVTRTIDPNGNDTQYVVNQLNQVVRRLSRIVDGNSLRYQRDTFYDVKDNVVRLEVLDINDGGILQSDPNITTTSEYDTLNRLVRTISEVNSVHSIVTEYEYDDNDNLTLTRSGEATNRNQPNNVVRTVYDERDMVFNVTRAEGDPNHSTTRYDYDKNGNVIKVSQGLEGTPRDSNSIYDGFDRLIQAIDPMGNKTEFHYDPTSNVISKRIDGELIDIDGDANNLCLYETTYEYDLLNRRTRSTVSFFDPNTQKLIGDGNSITDFIYSDNSQLIKVIDDNGNQTRYEYDTINRKSLVIDPNGNTVSYTYDRNSNVVEVNEIDVSDLSEPNVPFVTTYAYDNLSRLTSVTDNNNNTTEYGYDSRNNKKRVTDALSNETRYEYDARNRLTRIVRDMDGDGADANDVNDIVTTKKYDDNSRIIEQTDDSNNTTAYEYDALDRTTKTTHADDTNEIKKYDVHNNVTRSTDAAGNVITSDYDTLNRLTGRSITPGAGVSPDPNFEEFKYDGMSRMVYAENNNSVVTRRYDSLSNLVSETLNREMTASTYDGLGNKLLCTYPGGRAITNTYTPWGCKKTISAGGSLIGSYDYIGRRVRRLSYGNSIKNDYSYDDVKRITGTKHSVGVAIVDERSYSYDAMYNKTQRKDKRVGGLRLTHNYTYDGIHRLTQTIVKDAAPATIRDTQYTLDGVGNRTNVGGVGTLDRGDYTLDANTPPADLQMNQYTDTSFDSRQYDENGNLSTIDSIATQKNIIYDYRNLIVEVNDVNTGQVHTYAYDALGRRIEKVVDSTGTPQTTQYFYEDARVIEEQDANNVTQATYVYGNYIDEVLNMRRDSNDYYYHADDMYNVMAITDSNGTVVERYEYGDYGEPDFILTTAGVDNPYLFNGRRYDSETGLYYYRTRYLDPKAGRFTSRDSIGIWGDSANMGNGSAYAGNNPWSSLDPFGLKGKYCMCSMSKCSCGCKIISTEIVAMLSAGGGGGGGNGGQFGNLIDSMINLPSDGVTIAGHGHGGHITVLKTADHGHGHQTVLKIAEHGHYHGHQTVLKVAGGGDHNGSVDFSSKKTMMASGGGGSRRGRAKQLKGYLRTGDGEYTGHITVLKSNDHHGHITVLKIAGGGDHNGTVTISAKKTSMASGGAGGGGGGVYRVQYQETDYNFISRLMGDPHHGHQTVLKIAGGGDHNGSVTISATKM